MAVIAGPMNLWSIYRPIKHANLNVISNQGSFTPLESKEKPQPAPLLVLEDAKERKEWSFWEDENEDEYQKQVNNPSQCIIL